MGILVAIVVLLASFLVSVGTSDAATPASRCATVTGLSTQFVDAQTWWMRTPGAQGSDFGHLHLGSCIPERERLVQPVVLPTRIVLHNNPGKFLYVSLVTKGTDYETTVAKYPITGFSCATGTCEAWISVELTPSMFRQSGLQEVRLRAFVDEPDGNRMIASLNWQTYVVNGQVAGNVTRLPFVRGKGWYTGAGYCESDFASVPVPDGPVSGKWAPVTRQVNHGTSNDRPVSRHEIRLDPNLHEGVPGTILAKGDGQRFSPVEIDTTLLADGAHTLFLRTECDDPRGSTNVGVLTIPFLVDN
jgi:hypothetical protein